MRTTLTLDDDVAAALARRRAERGTGLRHEVNELLRAGLSATSLPALGSNETYELPTFDPGRALCVDTGAGATPSRHPQHTARSAAVGAARH